MHKMREIMNNELSVYKGKEIGLLFSGGMDSLCILLSCLDVGIKPHLYTFKLAHYDSEDYLTSKRISEIFDLELTTVVIDDTDVGKLRKDVEYIIKRFNTKRKIRIQCIYPFLYVVPQVKEKIILTGLTGDTLQGTSNRKMFVAGRHNHEEFQRMRWEELSDLEDGSFAQVNELFKEKGIELVDYYRFSKGLIEYMMPMNFLELNRPKEKMIMYTAFKDEIDKYKLYRRGSSYQCNSRIREWHDKLLETDLNVNNNVSVVAIYNRMYKMIWGE